MKKSVLLLLILAATRLRAEPKISEVNQLHSTDLQPEESQLINERLEKMVYNLFLGKHDGPTLDSGEHALRRNWLIYTPHGPRYVSNPRDGWSVQHSYKPRYDQDADLINHIWALHNREDLKPGVLRSRISVKTVDPFWGCNKIPHTLWNLVDPIRTEFCKARAELNKRSEVRYTEMLGFS